MNRTTEEFRENFDTVFKYDANPCIVTQEMIDFIQTDAYPVEWTLIIKAFEKYDTSMEAALDAAREFAQEIIDDSLVIDGKWWAAIAHIIFRESQFYVPQQREFKIQGFEQLHAFMDALESEFPPTDFNVINPLIKRVTRGEMIQDIKLDLSSEGSIGRKSTLHLDAYNNITADGSYGQLRFLWTTSSQHKVSIQGEWSDCNIDGRVFKVSFGEDISYNFYPIVEDIINSL